MDSNDAEKEKNNANFINVIGCWMDKYVWHIRYTSYCVAAVGVAIIAKKIFLFHRFRSASDVPADFISRHVRLHGHVREVLSSGTLLVDHTPIVQLSVKDVGMHLPVRLAGVELSEDAYYWMKDNLTDRHVWFQLLHRSVDESVLFCSISAQRSFLRRINVGQHLVQQGLASIDTQNPLPVGRVTSRVMSDLIRAQQRAERKGRGMWQRAPVIQRLKEALSITRLLDRIRSRGR